MTVQNDWNEVENVIGTRTENVGGPGPVKGADTPGSERGKGTGRAAQEKRSTPAAAAVVSERENVGWQGRGTTRLGREVETRRDEAGAEIARETGREAKGLMGRRWVRQRASLRVGSESWGSRKEKWPRAQRSAENGTERRTGTGGAATGTETDVGGTETETETESTRGSVERETGGSGKRSATVPRGRMWVPRWRWATRTTMHRHKWRSTARTD